MVKLFRMIILSECIREGFPETAVGKDVSVRYRHKSAKKSGTTSYVFLKTFIFLKGEGND